MAALTPAMRRRLPGGELRRLAGIAPEGMAGPNYFEAEVAVVGEAVPHPSVGLAAQPLLIAEILSQSTVEAAMLVKLPGYRLIGSLREIIYLEADWVGATLYRRTGPEWRQEALWGGQARLRSDVLGLEVPLSSLYRDLPGL